MIPVSVWQVQPMVLRANNLPKMDVGPFGKCDGFVRLYLDEAIVGETLVAKKDYSPVWNHQFPVLQLSGDHTIRFEVYDWDKVGDNDLIAKVSFTVDGLLNLAQGFAFVNASWFTFETVIPLVTTKKAKSGRSTELCLSFTITWPAEIMAADGHQKLLWLNQKRGNDKLTNTLKGLRIHPQFHSDLLSLNRFDVVMVLDDSGSMGNNIKGQGNVTRWDELKEVAKIAIDIGTCLDSDGIELMFLNRRGASNVTSFDQVKNLFVNDPDGTTPLPKVCREAFSKLTPNKPLLVLIATDGTPDGGAAGLSEFTRVLMEKSQQIFVGILACSDNDHDVGYLNKLDVEVPQLDVLDDYLSEKESVQRIVTFADYTLGDHCARLFLGPVFDKYDKLDGL